MDGMGTELNMKPLYLDNSSILPTGAGKGCVTNQACISLCDKWVKKNSYYHHW